MVLIIYLLLNLRESNLQQKRNINDVSNFVIRKIMYIAMLKNIVTTEINRDDGYHLIIWKINTIFMKLAKVTFDKLTL